MKSVQVWFYYLITLAYRVPECYKITIWAKLLGKVHMVLVSAVDCSLIDINVTKCRAVRHLVNVEER
jgi:hypothetical protein